MVFGLWRVARARRAASGRIGQLVEHSRRRCGGIPDHAWREPYMIGLVSTLITLTAKSATDQKIGDEQLGLVQSEAWPDITGVQDQDIGEKICMYSLGRDPAFMKGCGNAIEFYQSAGWAFGDRAPYRERGALGPARLAGSNDLDPAADDEYEAFGDAGPAVSLLWAEYFEGNINFRN